MNNVHLYEHRGGESKHEKYSQELLWLMLYTLGLVMSVNPSGEASVTSSSDPSQRKVPISQYQQDPPFQQGRASLLKPP